MKQYLLFFFLILFTSALWAQRTVRGTVTDASDGAPLPGVNIVVKGTTIGTATNVDGEYRINVEGDETVLVFSFVGYQSKEVVAGDRNTIDVSLQLDVQALEEVVLIGYGTVKKDDATGSVTAINSEDFNRGAIATPQELLSGRIAGVQITSAGGAPGTGSRIRIRGGSSLTASNDPLIVIDGVPVSNSDVSGLANSLSTINPNDIETFTVLKDASATAIYGSRASNGVIIITTKKGIAGQPLNVEYNGFVSVSSLPNRFDVYNGDEYRELINEQYPGDSVVLNLLGTENTDWQDQIFQTALHHDHNLSVSGSVQNIPYRASVGYTNQDGILKTSSMERLTGALSLNPSFLNNSLKLNLNLKAMTSESRFAGEGAVGSAISFDPTKPVYDEGNGYGGYWIWLDENDNPNQLAPRNPLAQLEQREDIGNVNRLIGNFQVDYSLPFVPGLRANLNFGYDWSDSEGTVKEDSLAGWTYDPLRGGGIDRLYTQDKKNELLDFYLNYNKDLGAPGRVDVTAGYSWQHFYRDNYEFETNVRGQDTLTEPDSDPTEYYLVSFFGRLNYIFKDRYLFTATLRQDGSSRFSEENRFGLFPSFAFAWDINDEPFLEGADFLSEMKLRLGYGITGQQDIAQGDYPYLARYTLSTNNARYQFGDQYVKTLRPEGYDANLKWEETTTYNIGLDFGFLNSRVTGSIDLYQRDTEDLINEIPVPAGTNFKNLIVTNVGNLTNRGLEFTLNAKPISTMDMFWDVGFNLTYNENEITKLTTVDDPDYVGVFVGGISGAVGNTIQIHSVGYPTNAFYVWEQVYDDEGYPIEGLYVDRDGDGILTDEDKYRLGQSAPKLFLGFNSLINYKNIEFSFAGRANFGNYVYNNMFSANARYANLYWPTGYLNNVSTNLEDTRFNNAQFFSDYYVEDGSFLRMDYITLAYNFDNIMGSKLNARIYGTVQNAFVITKYSGLDPEVDDGIDNNVYPRPRIFLLGLRLGL